MTVTKITHASFMLVRTPLDSYDAILGLDRDGLRRWLDDLVHREALALASPSLVDALPGWLADPESEQGRKVERSLVRYVFRAATRPTPFGLFAGCSLARAAESTSLDLGDRSGWRRHARLDTGYLCRLRNSVARDSVAYVRANETVYPSGGKLRYVFSELTTSGFTHSLAAVDDCPEVRTTLALATAPIHRSALAGALSALDSELELADLSRFIDDLVDNQLLVVDLPIPTTGIEPQYALRRRLEELHTADAVCHGLSNAEHSLAVLNRSAVGSEIAAYGAIADALRPFVDEEPHKVVQVDLHKHAALTFGPAVQGVIAEAVTTCWRLAPAHPPAMLREFARAFAERYEEQEVLLLEALDDDAGVGFGSRGNSLADTGWLAGLPLASPPVDDALSARDRYLMSRVMQVTAAGRRELVLDDADLAALDAKRPPPRGVPMAMMATIYADSADAIDRGELELAIHTFSSGTALRLLGRFCHGDPQLETCVREFAAHEQALANEPVHVEIVHQPHGRVGNVLLRPSLRRYELGLLGESGAPASNQLPLDDITVSVVGGRIVLRSRRLGVEIKPQLTNAHNWSASENLSVYRFLAALANAGDDLGFRWGPLAALPVLPRVRCGRLLLSRARWLVDASDLAPLGEADASARFILVQHLRRKLDLPRFVELADSDNVLTIDLDSHLSVDTFVSLVGRRVSVTIYESLASERGLPVHGIGGRYTHELVVPFIAGERGPAQERETVVPSNAFVTRRFPPGSEWLYAKLYCGRAQIDDALRRLAPVVRDLLHVGDVDLWHFVRYADPEPHVRLRFHGQPEVLNARVWPQLADRFASDLANGHTWRLQFDTYVREVERYGGAATIGAAERMFHADSMAALAIVTALDDERLARERWRIALIGIDRLLADLALPLEDRCELMARVRDSFAVEHGDSSIVARDLGRRFRDERAVLEQWLDGRIGDREIDAAFALRTAAHADAIAVLTRHLPPTVRDRVVLAFVHMQCNRLLHVAPRVQELGIYDFLARVYRGAIARQRRFNSICFASDTAAPYQGT